MGLLRTPLLLTVLALSFGSGITDAVTASAAAVGAGTATTTEIVGGEVGSVLVTYQLPLRAGAAVLTPFDPPASGYGAGHLGVDLGAADGQSVYAAAAGEVRFAGQVAGRGVLVLSHADGLSTEYEPIRPAVHRGQQVAAGSLLGHIEGAHRACAPRTCLHWGARRGTQYLDPLGLVRPLGPVRLLPG